MQQVIYRHILLKSISDLWIEHLTRMEALRVSIRMEAYAQRDPLVQYKRYSTDTFKELLANIRLAVDQQNVPAAACPSQNQNLPNNQEKTLTGVR